MARPRGLKAAGKRLWDDVVGEFELAEHELTLLEQAVRTADLCATLQASVDAYQGRLSTAGGRSVPELIELRQQRIVLARLITALRVPLGETDRVPQYRGMRGAYQPRGVA